MATQNDEDHVRKLFSAIGKVWDSCREIFPLIPVMQINRSYVALTSLLASTLFRKPFLLEQQIELT